MTAMADAAVTRAKQALRTAYRARRRELAATRDREADARLLAQHVLALVSARCQPRQVCRVAAYDARPTEPPTHQLIEALEAAGHEVIVPLLLEDKSLDWTRRGVRLGPDAIGSASVVIAPGLAVDRRGVRLGQGGGSYDRALLSRRPDALVVTLLHDGELADEPLPLDEHDARVDAVITPERGLVSLPTWG